MSPAATKAALVEPDDDPARGRQARVVEQWRELRVEQQRAHPGVRDDVRELARLVARVDGHRDGAHPHRAEEHRERLDPVRVEQPDPVAVPDARRTEPARHRPRQLRELREVDALRRGGRSRRRARAARPGRGAPGRSRRVACGRAWVCSRKAPGVGRGGQDSAASHGSRSGCSGDGSAGRRRARRRRLPHRCRRVARGCRSLRRGPSGGGRRALRRPARPPQPRRRSSAGRRRRRGAAAGAASTARERRGDAAVGRLRRLPVPGQEQARLERPHALERVDGARARGRACSRTRGTGSGRRGRGQPRGACRCAPRRGRPGWGSARARARPATRRPTSRPRRPRGGRRPARAAGGGRRRPGWLTAAACSSGGTPARCARASRSRSGTGGSRIQSADAVVPGASASGQPQRSTHVGGEAVVVGVRVRADEQLDRRRRRHRRGRARARAPPSPGATLEPQSTRHQPPRRSSRKAFTVAVSVYGSGRHEADDAVHDGLGDCLGRRAGAAAWSAPARASARSLTKRLYSSCARSPTNRLVVMLDCSNRDRKRVMRVLGREVVIVEAVRTPIGRGHREKGQFRDVHPATLLAATYTEVLERAGVDGADGRGRPRRLRAAVRRAVVQHRPQRLAAGRPAVRDARDDDRPPVRLRPAGRQLRRHADRAPASTTSRSARGVERWAGSRCSSAGSSRTSSARRSRPSCSSRYDLSTRASAPR